MTKNAKLDVKVSAEKKEEFTRIAEQEYDLNLSEWVRQAIQYVADNKPILGKGFAPRGQSLIVN